MDCRFFYNLSVFPLSGIVEYASVTSTVGGKNENALTGAYAECAYKAGKLTAYTVRGVNNLASSSASTTNYKNNIFLATSQPIFIYNSNLYKINNDYTLIGLAYPISSNVTVRAEYLIDDDATVGAQGEKGFMIWWRVSY
ncbi:MAG TPA: hypothetical protein DDW50_17800 [Firmicutes bacterium]|nr:hypothetical protein [Bacillota bacterium]